MQVNAPHIFVIMVMAMPMVVSMAVTVVVIVLLAMIMAMRMTVRVTMIMAVMVMSKRHHADQIHSQAQTTDNKELAETLRLRSLPQSLKRLKCDFNTE